MIGLASLALASCVPNQPCGWDYSLTLGETYAVSILERYSAESALARYDAALDVPREHPLGYPPCASLDDVAPGATFDVRLAHDGRDTSRCGYWFGEIDDVELGSRHPTILGSTGHNLITVSGRRALGASCSGVWELDVHMPSRVDTDPFRAPDPFEIPVTLVYRFFIASRGSEDGCMERAGVSERDDDGRFRCQDAFVAQMSRDDVTPTATERPARSHLR